MRRANYRSMCVLEYVDHPLGRMIEGDGQRKGHFKEAELRPQILKGSSVGIGPDIQMSAWGRNVTVIPDGHPFKVRSSVLASLPASQLPQQYHQPSGEC